MDYELALKESYEDYVKCSAAGVLIDASGLQPFALGEGGKVVTDSTHTEWGPEHEVWGMGSTRATRTWSKHKIEGRPEGIALGDDFGWREDVTHPRRQTLIINHRLGYQHFSSFEEFEAAAMRAATNRGMIDWAEVVTRQSWMLQFEMPVIVGEEGFASAKKEVEEYDDFWTPKGVRYVLNKIQYDAALKTAVRTGVWVVSRSGEDIELREAAALCLIKYNPPYYGMEWGPIKVQKKVA